MEDARGDTILIEEINTRVLTLLILCQRGGNKNINSLDDMPM